MSEPGMSVRNLPRGNLLKLPQELGLICCVAMGDFDPELYTQLGLLLSDKAPVIDNLVQEAALKSTTVLVQRFIVNCRMAFMTAYPSDSFPEFGGELAHHLRCFVTSPLPILEFVFSMEKQAPSPLTAAAKCFSLCIKVSLATLGDCSW